LEGGGPGRSCAVVGVSVSGELIARKRTSKKKLAGRGKGREMANGRDESVGRRAHLPMGSSIHMNLMCSTGTPSLSANFCLTPARVSLPSLHASMVT